MKAKNESQMSICLDDIAVKIRQQQQHQTIKQQLNNSTTKQPTTVAL